MIVIDGENAVLGRLGAYAAKQALLGETIAIVNAEKILVTGKKRWLVEEAKRRNSMGVPRKGPFFSGLPDRYVRRAIRGMLPYKTPRGRDAFGRIMCYIGIPSNIKEKPVILKEAITDSNAITIGRICQEIGGKVL